MSLLWQLLTVAPEDLHALGARHGLTWQQVEAVRALLTVVDRAVLDPRSPQWPALLAAQASLAAPPAARPKVDFGMPELNATAPLTHRQADPALPFSGKQAAPAPSPSSLEPNAAFGTTIATKRRGSHATLPFQRPPDAALRPSSPPAPAADDQAADLAAQFTDAFRRRQT